MQAKLSRMSTSLERLSAAVDQMHEGNVACRRATMVLRARMDSAERGVLSLQAKLEEVFAVLDMAEQNARKASDIFRATAEGRSAA